MAGPSPTRLRISCQAAGQAGTIGSGAWELNWLPGSGSCGKLLDVSKPRVLSTYLAHGKPSINSGACFLFNLFSNLSYMCIWHESYMGREMNFYTHKHTKIKMQNCRRMLGTTVLVSPESQ